MKVHYLDNACIGPASPATVKAVSRLAQRLGSLTVPGTTLTRELFKCLERARRKVSDLFSVPVENLAAVESTTHGLGIVASSYPFKEGDNVLVNDLEFLATSLIWRQLQTRGVEVRAVASRSGMISAQDYLEASDRRTCFWVISSVQEVTGYRCDVAAFVEAAHRAGAFLLVDAIQEAGALPVCLGSLPVDCYCAGGHKWLRSPFGLGFLYVSPRLLGLLSPPFIGYLGLQEPSEGWDRYLQSPGRTPFDDLPARRDAPRLEPGGTPNWTGAAALEVAVAEILETGQQRLWNQIGSHVDRITEGLRSLGLDFLARKWLAEGVPAHDCPHASGIVTFGLPGGLEVERDLLECLRRDQVLVSLRYISGVGGIRVSPHGYNSRDDIEILLDRIGRFKRDRL